MTDKSTTKACLNIAEQLDIRCPIHNDYATFFCDIEDCKDN